MQGEYINIAPNGIVFGYRMRNRTNIKIRKGGVKNPRNNKPSVRPLNGDELDWLTFKEVIAHTSHGHEIYGCICECGNKIAVTSSSFRGKRTGSCGCKRKLHNYESSKKQVMSHYKLGAKKRGYNFELTGEQFNAIILMNCYYCGSPPLNKCKSKQLQQPDGPFMYSGVDRFDNSKGYTVSNCVPSCAYCNRMKSNIMSGDDFINHCSKIITNHL